MTPELIRERFNRRFEEVYGMPFEEDWLRAERLEAQSRRRWAWAAGLVLATCLVLVILAFAGVI